MKRRQFFQHIGMPLVAASALSTSFLKPALAVNRDEGTSAKVPDSVPAASCSGPMQLAPIRATVNRITGVYTCTRPFRHAGPRLDIERLGHKHIVHNYGHGGSGWSLSWGSGALAVRLAQTTGARSIGVIGCGALGLTAALLAQRAGMAVRIYAKALPPDVPSMNASGIWTPDSRICDAQHAPELAARWMEMARISYATYQKMLGLPGNPVEWYDSYSLSDEPFGTHHAVVSDEPEYGEFRGLTPEIEKQSDVLLPGSHPFSQPYVRRNQMLMFNISTYARMLMADFLAMGGKIEIAEFSHAKELLKLPEHTLINSTGYGARALFNDESVIPVRGQTLRLIPQTEVTYGLSSRHLSVIPRRDGILVQYFGDTGNFNNTDTTPDRNLAEYAVRQLAQLVKT
jgi:hypothetical protein